VRNGAPRSVVKGRRGMTNEATPAILYFLYYVLILTKLNCVNKRTKVVYTMVLSLTPLEKAF